MYYPVAISYRAESQGAGAFYDHYTIRRIMTTIALGAPQIAGSPTRIVSPANVTEHPLNPIFRRERRNLQLPLDANEPDVVNDTRLEGCDLLIVPGRARATENDQPTEHIQRQHFEYELIKQALLVGRPILAICAGAWAL